MSAPVSIVDETASTNDDARALALQGAPHGACVAARRQTSGRGRRGHSWSSPDGGLYLSVVLRPEVAMYHYVGLGVVCSLGVLDALRELGSPVALKWPNDVLLGHGKVGGLLVEAGSSAEGPFAVCGIGLNLVRPQAGPAHEAGAAPSLPAAYLSDSLPAPDLAFDRIAELVRSHVADAVAGWGESVRSGRAAAGPLAPVLDAYYDVLPALGRPCAVYAADGSLVGDGVFAGVDCWGRATVVTRGGEEHVYSSEQVSLRGAVADGA